MRRRTFWLLIAALVAATPAGAKMASPTDGALAIAKCSRAKARDWICSERRRTTVTTSTQTFVATRAPSELPNGSTVQVAKGGRARVTFGRDASCRFGDRGGETGFVTRYGDPAALFTQFNGLSYCTFVSRSRGMTFFCDADGCPVIVKTRGRTESVVHTSNPVIIDFCAGSFSILIRREDGTAGVSGSSSDVTRTRVTLTEISRSTENTSFSYIDLDVKSLPSRGPCDDAAFTR